MKPSSSRPTVLPCEVCILAGGLSSRMGRDKARLRLGGRTLLAHVRTVAGETGLPIRVIRKDLMPRCGPMGGLYTALKTTRAGAILFLACDMPFVPASLVRRILRRLKPSGSACFTRHGQGVGFPLLLCAGALAQVERCLKVERFSLQGLAEELEAVVVSPTAAESIRLLNLNTPADIANIPSSILPAAGRHRASVPSP